jgi:hypothetical protein
MDDAFLEFDFDWHSQQVCGGVGVETSRKREQAPWQAAGSGHRCAARTVLLCNTCIITSWTAATSFLSACLHYSSPYSTPVCLQDVELEIQVLPGNMDKAWIPDFIENKLKEALCFSVSRALLISPGTAQAVQHRHFRQRRAAQGCAGSHREVAAPPCQGRRWHHAPAHSVAPTRQYNQTLPSPLTSTARPACLAWPAGGGGGRPPEGAGAHDPAPPAQPDACGGGCPGGWDTLASGSALGGLCTQ